MDKHAEFPGRLRMDAEQGLAGERQRLIAIVEGHIDRQAILLISQIITEKTVHETHGRCSPGLSGAGRWMRIIWHDSISSDSFNLL